MKRKLTVIALLLSTTYLSAESYVGLNVGMGLSKETFSSGTNNQDIDNDYKNISLIFGTGEDGEFKFQGRLNIVNLDKPIYDNSHDTLIEIGVDGIKEFEVSPSLYPFLKAGFASGYIGTDDRYYDSPIAAELSLNVGAGLSYKINEQIDLLGGVDYVYHKYQNVKSRYRTISISASGFEPYIGMRYSF